jgi:hypothetical protein
MVTGRVVNAVDYAHGFEFLTVRVVWCIGGMGEDL